MPVSRTRVGGHVASVGAATPRAHVEAGTRVYLPIAFVAALIALVGFWPTYVGPLLAGTPQKAPFIHVHAAVFTGWLLLVIAQTSIAASGRTHGVARVRGLGHGAVRLSDPISASRPE